LDNLRLATREEVESIRLKSDLGPTSTVVAFEHGAQPSDLAVIKQVTELDPVFFQDASDTRRRVLFIWALENAMRIMGLGSYYFQVPVADETWIKNIEGWGAERLSTEPQFRYTKLLQVPQPEKA
jgi:hypothetical protein